jgi:hypothetical protein
LIKVEYMSNVDHLQFMLLFVILYESVSLVS